MAMSEGAQVDGSASAETPLGVPAWLPNLLAWKTVGESNKKVKKALGVNKAPNIADVDNVTSLRISSQVFEELGIEKVVAGRSAGAKEENLGAAMEQAVEAQLATELAIMNPVPRWSVRRNSKIYEFVQYSHLDELQKILEGYPDLRVTFGGDYLVKPDVVVSLPGRRGSVLHAVVSCKWTIRSDRAQNVRHEFNLLIRARRGRAPHLVAVTAEPLPSRISSLTRGTGEIDVVYHVAYGLMGEAVKEHGSVRHRKAEPSQAEHWAEMVGTGRIRDYGELVADIAID